MGIGEPKETAINVGELSIDENVRKRLADDLSQSFVHRTAKDGSGITTCVPEKSQQIVDKVYSDEYQAEKLATASLDKFGRPVRYYRQIDLDSLLDLLRSGEESATGHHTEPFSLSDPALKDVAEFLLKRRKEKYEGEVPELLYKLFSKSSKEDVDKAFGIDGNKTDWQTVLAFFERRLPPDEVKKFHVVAMYHERILKYSPYLSLCPGGPRIYPPGDFAVLLELVIPDEEITINNMNRIRLEREVLVHKIEASNISRIIFGEKAFSKLIDHNPETPVGQYILEYPDENVLTAHGNWLLKTPIEDTLPANFIK